MMAMLIVVLVACADSSSTDSTETDDTGDVETSEGAEDVENEESDAASEITLEEVYEKAIERQNEINSMSADIVMDQNIVLDESGGTFEMKSNSNLQSDFTIDPVASYMHGTVTAFDPMSEQEIELETEMYMLEDAFYMYDSEGDQWLEFPLEEMEAVLGQSAQQIDATEQLELLESIISEFSLEEEGDEYILKLDAAEDKFTEFVIEEMKALQSVGITEAEEDIVNLINYDKVSYVLKINKDTYDMTAMDLVLNMTLEEGDESLVMNTDTKITFSNFDGIDAIEVPQEVVDEAVPVEY